MSSEKIEINVLKLDSVFTEALISNDQRRVGYHPFDAIIHAVIKFENANIIDASKNLYIVKKRDNKKRLQLCCNIDRNSKIKSRNCSFNIYAKYNVGNNSAVIKQCELNHSCRAFNRLALENQNSNNSNPQQLQVQRVRNVNINVLSSIPENKILTNLVNIGRLSCKNNLSASIKETIDKEGEIHISHQQISKLYRKIALDSFNEHMKEFAQLENFLLACKNADPNGLYWMKCSELNYSVNNTFIDLNRSTAKMFQAIIIFPSCCMHFYSNSRKIVTMDGAHLKVRFDGVMLSVNCKDACNQIVTLLYSIVNQENKSNWTMLFDCIFHYLRDLQLIIADNEKGLEFIRKLIEKLNVAYNNLNSQININSNNPVSTTQLQPFLCVYGLCCLHRLKNCNIHTTAAKAAMTSLAKAPNIESYNYYFNELSKLVGYSVANSIHNKRDEFSFLSWRNRGLLTNYAEVTNNSSESQNHSHNDIRDQPVVTGIMTYLKKLSATFSIRKQEALEFLNDGFVVTNLKMALEKSLQLFQLMKEQWSYDLISIPNLTTLTAKFVVKGPNKFQLLLTLNASENNSLQWYERIKCSCEYTLSLGRPCFHALIVLCNLRKAETDGKIRSSFPLSIWGYYLAKWYSPIFHVKNYYNQYNVEVNLPDLNESSLKLTQIYPPSIVPRKGRTKISKNRKTKLAATSEIQRKKGSNNSNITEEIYIGTTDEMLVEMNCNNSEIMTSTLKLSSNYHNDDEYVTSCKQNENQSSLLLSENLRLSQDKLKNNSNIYNNIILNETCTNITKHVLSNNVITKEFDEYSKQSNLNLTTAENSFTYKKFNDQCVIMEENAFYNNSNDTLTSISIHNKENINVIKKNYTYNSDNSSNDNSCNNDIEGWFNNESDLESNSSTNISSYSSDHDHEIDNSIPSYLIALETNFSKKIRKCRSCGKVDNHNSSTCPLKNSSFIVSSSIFGKKIASLPKLDEDLAKKLYHIPWNSSVELMKDELDVITEMYSQF